MTGHTSTRKSSAGGFTLIELIVVISIIGILVSISSTRNSLAFERSKDAAVMVQLNHIRTAIHQFALDHDGRFPDRIEALSPTYLPRPVLNWTGSRASGIISFDAVTGCVRLHGSSGQSPENTPDSRGRPYAEY
ncbi:MAG TPA: type II secretion system protein [Candidatus Ozemobacteraceae bacterium]|nr:type II secretion system protein [Candidatus Ozemobacteraceae bacterium]